MTTPVAASRSGTAPPPAGKVASRPPRAPGMGPSKAGTAPPNTPAARRAARGGQQRQSPRRRPRVEVARKAPGDTAYQNVILAEFVLAVLLVAATPLAKKDSAGSGLSPYAATDLMQLVAITVTYFALALVSSANSGAARFAAWFGGLILIAVGLGEAARLAKLLDVFGLASPQPDPATTFAPPAPTGGQAT
jgi:hypothetical protein